MNIEVSDVHRTLEYRTDTTIIRGVPSALVLCLLGLVALAFDDPPAKIVFAGWVLVVAGIGWTGFALLRRSNPGTPLFVLSPKGVLYRIPWVKEILIPWCEIQGVDTIDITAWNWASRFPHRVTFHDVTAILVSKQFYDSHIFVNSLFLRGPGWGNIFIPKGSSIQIALHHELVSVEPRALREAIEVRWHAFRGQPAGSASLAAEDSKSVARTGSVPAIRSDPTPSIVASEPKPGTTSAWDIAKIVVPLIGIAVVLANLVGVWATPGQTAARAERKKWADWHQRRQEESRQLEEERKRIDKGWRDFYRRF